MKDFNCDEFMADADLQRFVEKNNEALMELQSKRAVIKEMKIESQTLVNKNMELHQELEKMGHEKQFLEQQLDEMKSISRQREDEWSTFRDSWAQNSMKLEIAIKTSDAYKCQASAQQAEIDRLTAENEELKKLVKRNNTKKDTNQIVKSRIEETITKLRDRICMLEKVQEEVSCTSKTAIEIAEKTDEFRKHYKMLLEKSNEEKERANKEVSQLSMELAKLTLPVNSEYMIIDSVDENALLSFSTEKFKSQLTEKFDARFDTIDNEISVYENIKALRDSEKDAQEKIKRLELISKQTEEKLKCIESERKKELVDKECQIDYDFKEETPVEMVDSDAADADIKSEDN
ncbi:chromosome partition protein Smc isoform X1 [Nilaparvata lugens]|uniref:chromosome partition protein Smc isoform X1 n=1 Tax=Nilaparvata lugens TaxID=108931 RepID=UPI00193CFBFE|nr:chromosome partition protein Smc isoform X1 [Nilaparvata lugens]XP_039278994.1 chromosome partition protein Smc isoform X1 [Nilaparvata lugens]XP_039278995.1 chromosome partition protein Smc isoform X1 [Nilaparvata lugens]XP_039278996.1 chromosome partition protein Smc isoform X1 [Nilaparvata lugens]